MYQSLFHVTITCITVWHEAQNLTSSEEKRIYSYKSDLSGWCFHFPIIFLSTKRFLLIGLNFLGFFTHVVPLIILHTYPQSVFIKITEPLLLETLQVVFCSLCNVT